MNASDTIVLLTDLEHGIADLNLTLPTPHLRRGVAALLKLAGIFELPLLITTVPGEGGTFELIEELEVGRRGTPVMVRTTPNAFNDREIRGALERSGRKTLLVSGAATEVAVQLPALTAATEGYDVHVLIDCCGGISARTEDAALRRLTQAGAHISSLPTVIGELAGDFREAKGQQAIRVLFELAGA